MTTTHKQSAEAAYAVAMHDCLDLLVLARCRILDLPNPEDTAIHYSHVGTIEEVRRRLQAVVAFMSGTEK